MLFPPQRWAEISALFRAGTGRLAGAGACILKAALRQQPQ